MAIRLTKVSPSIIATDYNSDEELKENLKKLEKAGVKMLHLDVMDGKFVKSTTFNHEFVEKIRDLTTLMLDVHLMIENPEKQIDKYIEAGAEILTVHFEALKKPKETLAKIRAKGVLAGLAISPKTKVSEIEEILKEDLINIVLVMSVEPGACGQKFIEGSEEKVRQIKKINKKITVEIDGGISPDNAKMVRAAGASILVSGSSVFRAKDMKKTIKKIKGGLFG